MPKSVVFGAIFVKIAKQSTAILACFFFGMVLITGCNGGGSSSSITAVSVTATPSSINAAQTATCAATVTGKGSYSSAVTWTATGGTISSAGVFTPSGAGSATCTATSTPDASKSGTATITVTAAPVQVTSIAVTATPASITTAQTSQCAAVPKGTGNFDPSVTWTATGGTITSDGVFSPSAAGNASCVATSNQPGSTTVTGTAAITVTASTGTLPTITSINPDPIFLNGVHFGYVFNGTDLGTGESLHFGGLPIADLPVTTATPNEFDSSQNINLIAGYVPVEVCLNSTDAICGAQFQWAVLGTQNTLAVAASGEVFVLDQTNSAHSAPQIEKVWKYKADGTADGSFSTTNGYSGIAVDETNPTGIVMTDGQNQDESGSVSDVPQPELTSGLQTGGVAAANGYACLLQRFGCYPETPGGAVVPVDYPSLPEVNSVPAAPAAMGMGTFSGETDAFVYSSSDSTLIKVRVTDGTIEGSTALNNYIVSVDPNQPSSSGFGPYVVLPFDSGPALGLVAVFSTQDKVLAVVNSGTMQILGTPVTLTGTPFMAAKDLTDGKVIIASTDLASGVTSYSSIDLTAGNPASSLTTLQSTDTLLSIGLGVSADGTKIYSAQRNQLHVLANQ